MLLLYYRPFTIWILPIHKHGRSSHLLTSHWITFLCSCVCVFLRETERQRQRTGIEPDTLYMTGEILITQLWFLIMIFIFCFETCNLNFVSKLHLNLGPFSLSINSDGAPSMSYLLRLLCKNFKDLIVEVFASVKITPRCQFVESTYILGNSLSSLGILMGLLGQQLY